MQLGNEDERILDCVDDVMMMWCGMDVEERSWGSLGLNTTRQCLLNTWERTGGNDEEGKLDLFLIGLLTPLFSGHRHTFLPSSSLLEITEHEHDAEAIMPRWLATSVFANNRFLSNIGHRSMER